MDPFTAVLVAIGKAIAAIIEGLASILAGPGNKK